MGNFLWTIPFQVITAIFLLYCQLGVSAIIGAIALILILPLQVALASLLSRFQKRAMEFTDKRIKQCNELLQSIKLLKLYAWELVFRDRVEKTRNLELKMILKAACLRALSIVVTECIPIIAIMTTFLIYRWIEGKTLTANKVFSGVALFNILLIPLLVVSLAVNALSHARVSCRRMNTFLEMNEVESVFIPLTKADRELNTLLEISNGNFSWKHSTDKSEDQEIILSSINLTIKKGSLTVIAGPVGSGKSSLLAALLGEMNICSGSVKRCCDSKLAFGSQRAWLLNATLKDNILFGSSLIEEKYERVIAAAALKQDIAALPGGDNTEIGERGINLSGGQKQRISIARTLYADTDIVLLDDPMSALDVHVGRHIFEEAICSYLINELKRTVVLVTHQVQYLPKADNIIAMEGGKIVAQGTYGDICDNYPHLVKSWEETEMIKYMDPKKVKSLNSSEIDLNRGINLFSSNLTRSSSIVSLPLSRISLDNFEDIPSVVPQTKQNESDKGEETGKLIDSEEIETGSVSWRVYKKFILAASIRFSVSTLLAYFIRQSLRVGSDFWLAHWSQSSTELRQRNTTEAEIISHQSHMMLIYVLICCCFVIFSVVSSLLTEYTCIRGSKRLHSTMLHRLIDAPMRFFDITPIGRIVNRFTGDVMILDERLAQVLDELFYCSFFSLGGVIVNAISSYYFIVAAIPLVAIYLLVQRFYIPSCRDLQRLNSVSKSPVLSHFGETLGGLSTIRAHSRQSAFSKKNNEVVDKNNNAFFNLQATILWMGIRLDFVGSLTVFASIVCVLSSGLSGVASEGVVGLSIAYSLMISFSLNWMMKSVSETEMNFNAVERISHYINIKNESFNANEDVDKDWPSDGVVNIENLSLRYDENLDNVINNLSLSIKGGEKVGICGRTGSGKSSLMLGLFRLIDISGGNIKIDKKDISDIPLRNLRSHLSIIPQDPVLFAGTVRFNVDPVELYSDETIWKALDIAQLVPIIKNKAGLLDSPVAEGGENFSAGQRQLFCLARALLRNSKILIMDEATASVDMTTDKIVQRVVNQHFKDKTILTIAHRVSSILNYDTIVVLQNGNIVEAGPPSELKSKMDGIFSRMIHDNL
ncbi:DgyrCDS1959 [Dimorphilus gyrociliatus]|uniref:DgyrCDS1959 n=1 Tax=Dimorphilus gyrociliatus TaxID=2664684 RepID=A0A7I8VAL8_9ANNE|nr:DgyrCDS1959 [Dimorphilus gyrociliatus]